MSRHECYGGTIAESTEYGSRVTLSSGHVVHGVPHDSDAYRATAQRLGYGGDLLALCQHHDVLHCLLCDWLGIDESFSLREAAGGADAARAELALAEEEAVMAVQRFLKLASDAGLVSRPIL